MTHYHGLSRTSILRLIGPTNLGSAKTLYLCMRCTAISLCKNAPQGGTQASRALTAHLGADFFSWHLPGLDLLHDADCLDDQLHSLRRVLQSTHLHHVIPVE